MTTSRPCSRAAVPVRKATVTRSASSWPVVRLMTTFFFMARLYGWRASHAWIGGEAGSPVRDARTQAPRLRLRLAGAAGPGPLAGGRDRLSAARLPARVERRDGQPPDG